MDRIGAVVATGWDLSAARQVPATTARAQVVPWEGGTVSWVLLCRHVVPIYWRKVIEYKRDSVLDFRPVEDNSLSLQA